MDQGATPSKNPGTHDGVAFLLTQIGTFAAHAFSERLSALQLSPPDAGILRQLRIAPGISQQELAAGLRIHPSRLVAILDQLEQRKLVERRPHPDDRRLYALYLTPEGTTTLAEISQISREHQRALCAPLTPHESESLAVLLQKLAAHHGLIPGVHPGFQRLGPPRRGRKSSV